MFDNSSCNNRQSENFDQCGRGRTVTCEGRRTKKVIRHNHVVRHHHDIINEYNIVHEHNFNHHEVVRERDVTRHNDFTPPGPRPGCGRNNTSSLLRGWDNRSCQDFDSERRDSCW